MAKPKTTKTLGPLHFEDLEPHRFESLVRNLLYDFREWQNIEPTGQSGSDDGFDVRAWEKTNEIENSNETKNEDDNEDGGTLTTKTHLWKIQCKRESEIGPSRVETIIEETVQVEESIYGYILAAPATFSKKSYDIFREKLIEKGVKEFYIWGRSELEDMLYMPKNDRILFSFFGFSLNTQRRSKTSEIKFQLNNKNKLFRILSNPGQGEFSSSVLLRDYNDTHYPYKGEYSNFDKDPRWKEYIAFSYHPLGLWVHVNKFYAYQDKGKKEFDFDITADLLHRESDNGYYRDEKKEELKEQAESHWHHLLQNNQSYFEVDGLILFKDMLVIDEKGDSSFHFPHIFVDYNANDGSPFSGYRYKLFKNEYEVVDPTTEEYKKIDLFPSKHIPQNINKIYNEKCLDLDQVTLKAILDTLPRAGRLFCTDARYDYLVEGDVICVNKPLEKYQGDSEDKFKIEITKKYSTTVDSFTQENGDHYKAVIERQVSQQVSNTDKLTVLEFIEIYDWKIDKLTKSNQK